jgi:hypothetical protein
MDVMSCDVMAQKPELSALSAGSSDAGSRRHIPGSKPPKYRRIEAHISGSETKVMVSCSSHTFINYIISSRDTKIPIYLSSLGSC